MFRELAPLLKSTKGIVVVSVARISDTHLRASFYPHAEKDEDRPQLTPISLEGTPDELDGTLDLSPAVEARKSIDDQIKTAAEKAKADASTKAAEKPAETTPAPTPAKRKKAEKPEKPEAPAAPAAAPEPAAEPSVEELQRQVEEAEAKAKAEAEAKAKAEAEAKAGNQDEIARLKARLAALKGGA